ncbi:hypothetical protein NMG60_11000286 [Bertholletia excelsa]
MQAILHTIVGSPPPPVPNATAGHSHHHVAFYWDDQAEVLFSGWPGDSPGMYALALLLVFALAALVEWLTHLELVKPGANRVASAFFRVGLHAIRAGIIYMVMLAVMSYNAGVFLAAVLGHAVGFLVFGSRVFKKESAKRSDLLSRKS